VKPYVLQIGPAAHEKHQFQIGDVVSGKAQPVPDGHRDYADLYKVSSIRVERRGPPEQRRPADPDGALLHRCTSTGLMATGAWTGALCDQMRPLSLGIDHAD
jgi:hypothetical protein